MMSATCHVSLYNPDKSFEHIISTRDPKDLKPNPCNIRIYGTEPVDIDLMENIKDCGLKENLVIRPEGTLISGHRRWKALKELGYTTVPCIIRIYDSELEERKDLLAYNKQREKTYSQKMNESDEYKAIFEEEAKQREIEAGKLGASVRCGSSNRDNPIPDIGIPATAFEPENPENADDWFEESTTVMQVSDNNTFIPTLQPQKQVIENRTDFRTAEAVGLSRSTYNRLKPIHEATKAGNQVALKLMSKVDNEEISVSDVEKIFKSPQKLAEKAIEKIEANPRISPEKAIQEARIELKKANIKVQEPSAIPTGLYNVILADPPWRYDFSIDRGDEIENHYPTMSLDEIKAVKVPSANDCVLFLWSTSPKLSEALAVIESWGFTYKTNAVWDKIQPRLGFWFRGQHELLLVATKGKPSVPEYKNRFPSVIREKSIVHSRKPAIVREMIEKMIPNGRYLELFAREKREGWTVWGNQV